MVLDPTDLNLDLGKFCTEDWSVPPYDDCV